MDTLTVVLMMAGVAALLLVAAIVADHYLGRRMERRMSGEASGGSGKPNAADMLIELLDRTRTMMHDTVESAGKKN